MFATASREANKLQKMSQTTSMGVGPATLTLPSGSAKVLGIVRRETISEPDFYASSSPWSRTLWTRNESRRHPGPLSQSSALVVGTAGPSPSQTTAPAVGQAGPIPNSAQAGVQQDRANISANPSNIAQNRADIKTDRADFAQDQANWQSERRDLRQDYAKERAGTNEQSAISQARSDIRTDHQDIRQDLKADHHDLRADGQDLRKGGQLPAQQVARHDSKPATPAIKTNTQLTASTMANNAAKNGKQTQKDQVTQKAWYQWVW